MRSYTFFVSEIESKIDFYKNKINKKLIDSPFLESLDNKDHDIYLKRIKNDISIFNEENIPLRTKELLTTKEYDTLSGDMTVSIDGKHVPIIKASSRLLDTDRSIREEIFIKIQNRRAEDENKLDELFSKLLKLRHEIATNAGFENYRDYKFIERGRFDYTIQDCLDFQEAIKSEVLPALEELMVQRKEALGVDKLKPWDTSVNIFGKPPLKPFNNSEELINKTIECFYSLKPFFAECLNTMKNLNHLDLETRKGKAPGGYNYPLYETGAPFIFMNAAGTVKDVVTMVHEGGHAIHSFLTKDLDLTSFKSLTPEIAELASMSMEFFSMERWQVFFDNEEDLRRAKFQQIERSINLLPWVATVDKFQHWVYTHPKHSAQERKQAWIDINQEFSPQTIDWEGQEDAFALAWQKQLHIFQMPFYYIEYAIAQLGALGMWRQFKQNEESAMDNYISALSLGYTRSIPEMYETAGIKFDFSKEHVKELVQFVKSELAKLN